MLYCAGMVKHALKHLSRYLLNVFLVDIGVFETGHKITGTDCIDCVACTMSFYLVWNEPLDKLSCREHHRSFLEASSPVQKTPLKLSEVNLSWGDIFIIIKAGTQQGANWLIGWAFL